MESHPPKWADRILEWYCNPELLEDLQGDLHEIFKGTVENKNERAAKWLYAWLVLRSFRWSAIRKDQALKNSFTVMTYNNLKIAVRVLWKDRLNSGINLVGLTIGITCFLLLGLYVKQEVSFDHFHRQKDNIYRLWLKETYNNGNIFFNSVTPPRFEVFFEENFPEVQTAVQLNFNQYLVGTGEEKLTDQVAIISPEFFEVFDFPVVDGNTEEPLGSRESIVLSQSYAKKYFGDRDPLGKTLGIEILDGTREFVVNAIFRDPPVTSSIQFDMAISNVINDEIFGERYKNAWFSVGPETYVLLKDNSDTEKIMEKAEQVAMNLIGESRDLESYRIGLQPITDIHLNPAIPLGYAPVSNPQYIFILGAIGLLVLIIACVNYATLSIGQSMKRGKEVGVRKVLGAVKPGLILQYLSESILMVLIAMVTGTVVATLLIPTFNNLTNSNLQIVFESWHVLAFICGVLIIGFIAGIYPSLILSNLRALVTLRGGSSAGNKHVVRQGLMVFQFLITIFLISSTLIMRKQVNFLQNEDLGYTYKSAITARLFPRPGEDTTFISRNNSAMANGELLKSALGKYPEISDIAMASHVFGSNGWAKLVATEEDGTYWRFRLLIADPYFIPSFNIKMSDGRNFETGNIADERQGVIINQAAADYFGMEDPVGKRLTPKEFGEHIVLGVTEDFHYSSLHHEVDPLIIVQNPRPIFEGVSDGDILDDPMPKLMFTYNGPNISKAFDILETEWNNVFPNAELNWSFLDERIKLQYENEARMNRLVSTATIMSIVIAMLGLIGLIILVINSKVKEIGIRKVLGAGTITLFKLLYRNFGIQILIALVLSIPVTMWLMTRWLENFAFRVNIGVEVFIISGLIAVIAGSLVIGYHTFRASRVNPVESLRTE